MLDYSKVILGSNAFNILSLDVKNDRCSHAYLFVSADETYGMRFCEIAAELFINHTDSENSENNTLRIERRVHPDVKFYGEEKAIDVSAVSEIVDISNISPFEADKKIFIISNCQDMSEVAQNKILKTIEEPPKNTFYFLFATASSRLLQTVLSRVKKIDLDKLKPEQIQAMLEEKGVQSQMAEIIANCSNANGTFAEKLATDSGFIDFFNSIVSCFYEINGSRDVLKYSNLFGAKTVDKDELINIFLLILRDLNLILVGTENLVALKNILPKLKVISSTLNVNAVDEMIKYCLKAKENLHFNANATAVVDGVLFKLAEVKVKCRRL